MSTTPFLPVGIAVVIIILVMLFFTFVPVGLWVTAFFSGVKIKMATLIGLRLRRVAPSRIVNPPVEAYRSAKNVIGSILGFAQCITLRHSPSEIEWKSF